MNITGLPSLLREGTKHLSGLDEAILRNIEAVKALARVTRTSLGPNGMNKMLINQHDKLFVTKDAATIVKELDVIHPAAKMIVLASQMQEQEAGDGTNLVIVLAGQLLEEAETLIRRGLHPSEIIQGYEKAAKQALTILEELVTTKLEDPKNLEQVTRFIKPVVSAKQIGYEDVLAPLVASACINALPKNPKNFNVDNVRVTKIVGSGVTDAKFIKGFALNTDAAGTIKHVKNAKVAVLAGGLDSVKPETKGTVLLESAQELMNFSKSEEAAIEQIVKDIAKTGANVIVSGGSLSDLALHFIERHKLMAVKVSSKFQLRRVCKAVGAVPLVRMGAPTAEELGHCAEVNIEELAGTKVCIFKQDQDESPISTILIRASTDNILDDLERCVDDGVNVYKGMIKDGRFVAGGGAAEIEIARRLSKFADSTPGLDQYAINKFAESFEVVPRTLAENVGMTPTETVSSLYAAHQAGRTTDAVDIYNGGFKSAEELGVFDLFSTKYWAIKLASDAAVTVLRVDQIIMAKPAGGPKAREGKMDPDD